MSEPASLHRREILLVTPTEETKVLNRVEKKAADLGIDLPARLGPGKGYILVRLPGDAKKRRQLLSTRGVHGILGGKNPISVSSEEIPKMESTVRPEIQIHLKVGKLGKRET